MSLALWGLAFARVAGVALLVPPIGVRQIPPTLRLGAAAVIAVPVWLSVPQPGLVSEIALAQYLAYAVQNLGIGLVIGAFVAATIYGAGMAGAYVDRLAGWSGELRVPGATASLFSLLVAAGFVLTDGHLLLVDALTASMYTIGPVPEVAVVARKALLVLPAKMFAASIALAAPALLALLVCRVVVAAAERIGAELEQSGLSAVSAPVLGHVVLIVALPAVIYLGLWHLNAALNQLLTMLA